MEIRFSRWVRSPHIPAIEKNPVVVETTGFFLYFQCFAGFQSDIKGMA